MLDGDTALQAGRPLPLGCLVQPTHLLDDTLDVLEQKELALVDLRRPDWGELTIRARLDHCPRLQPAGRDHAVCVVDGVAHEAILPGHPHERHVQQPL